MRVFLIRHGEADAEKPEGLGDDARALTPHARQVLPGHFKALASYFGPIDALYTSPLVRAVQTSTVLATALGFAGPFRAHRSLYPDGPISGIEALLEHHPGRTVIVVGHQPLIGAAAAFLLGRTELPKAVSPGTVIGVERANAQATPSTSRLICFAQVGQPVLETLSNGV